MCNIDKNTYGIHIYIFIVSIYSLSSILPSSILCDIRLYSACQQCPITSRLYIRYCDRFKIFTYNHK